MQGKSWDKQKVVELLEPFLEMGMSINMACSQIGLPASTFKTWLSKDDTLRLKVHILQNQVNLTAINVIIERIHQGDFQASKWWLSRKLGDEFSARRPTSKVEETVRTPQLTKEQIQEMDEFLSTFHQD